MPNWVFNNVSISGKEEDLKKFMEKAGKPYMTYHKGVRYQDAEGNWKYDADKIDEHLKESPISFMNFATPEDIDAYFGASDYKPEGYDKLSTEERMAVAMRFSSDGWYDWNVRNWGTKWDACNPEITSDDPSSGSISYSFDTAWSPAEGAYRAMVEQHPELSFEFHCEEEQGWGVEFEGTDGELSITNEWDIPETHADWVKLDREDSCPCAYNEDPEDMYEDCPANTKATEQAVADIEEISEMLIGQA
jgi:hypothetical protein